MNCEIIKDLLPLYVDDMCSYDSKKEIEEHINNCENCRNLLQDYKTNINANIIDDLEIKSAKPMKKVNKIMKLTSMFLVIIILLGVILPFGIWAGVNDKKINTSFFSAYINTKKKTKYLIKGDIDEFIKGFDENAWSGFNIDKDCYDPYEIPTKELEIFYNRYLKGKNVKIKKIDVCEGKINNNNFSHGRMVDVQLNVENKDVINICFEWYKNKFRLRFFTEEVKDINTYRYITKSLNPLLSGGNPMPLYTPYKNQKSFDWFVLFIYEREKFALNKKDKLSKRLTKLLKQCEIQDINVKNIKYYEDDKEFRGELIMTLTDDATKKICVLKQTFICCECYYIPLDDAQLIDDGISQSTKVMLVNLF